MRPPGSTGCKLIMEKGIYSSKQMHTEEAQGLLLESPAVNLPLETQEGRRKDGTGGPVPSRHRRAGERGIGPLGAWGGG